MKDVYFISQKALNSLSGNGYANKFETEAVIFYAIGGMMDDRKMKVPEGLIDPKSYYEGFRDGADCKNLNIHLLGYDLTELMQIIEKHETIKKNEQFERELK